MNGTAELFAHAWQLHQANDLVQAERFYRQILQHDPSHADAWCFLGAVCQARGNPVDAEHCYRRALELVPGYVSALNCLGSLLAERGGLDEAADCFQRVLSFQPDDSDGLNNLGLVRARQGRFDEAVSLYHQVLRIRSDFPTAHYNLGLALEQLGRFDEAEAAMQRALQLQPNYADAQYDSARLLLRRGDFAAGWPRYEWRWTQAGARTHRRSEPRWDGSPLNGRTVLLLPEQGWGDTIQFVRYAPLVQQRGGRVVLACAPALLRLLRSCLGIDCLLPEGGALPSCHAQAPLLSLPGILGTTLQNVPATIPYLAAPTELLDAWGARLRGLSGLRVGIAWQGNPGHAGDRNRSVPVSAFEVLARQPGVHLASLQKGPGAEQVPAQNARCPGMLLELPLEDFADTAAVIQHLDLVVTVDTAVAHLAGALGVAVWVALPFVADWRWLRDREDSPWYPTMRLFRQRRVGDWTDVFQRIAAALRTHPKRRPMVREGEAPMQRLDAYFVRLPRPLCPNW
jgi:Tfp pilus assembly protein PilF